MEVLQSAMVEPGERESMGLHSYGLIIWLTKLYSKHKYAAKAKKGKQNNTMKQNHKTNPSPHTHKITFKTHNED